ncbi:Ger(x)C family spore germination protein [Paenibacillus sp. NPDC058071]|uniref:Ger(x)C family spore germination protein n=1 Tax=Paenibacillus sp. NPDC058071 TaxID=3346326 RepID=UPI0036DB8313
MDKVFKSFVKIIVIVLCLSLLSGCWSRRELNELLIVLGFGLDWENGEYLASYQVVNPSEITAQKRGGERPPTTLYQGRGKTMLDAARSLTAEAPRKVYMGHLQFYVISEELARRGIAEFIDNALRDNEHRMDFKVVVARDMKAEDILKLYTPLEKLPTNSMLHSLETSERNWAPTISITLDEVLDRMSSEGIELALTGIKLIGTVEEAERKKNVETFQPSSRYRYKGIAIFRGDKLVGWLNEKESKGYTDITDNLESTSVEIPCGPSAYTGVEINSSEAEIKTKVVNGKPEATVYIRSEGSVNERECDSIDLMKPSTIKLLEEQTAVIIRSNAEAAVRKAKSLRSDCLGFGIHFAKDHAPYWKEVKKNWNNEHFPSLKVQYKIKMKIRKTGTTGNSTLNPNTGG